MADAKIMGMPRKTAIVFGIGGVAALGALLWYRHRQAAGAGTAAAPATADTSTDPATGLPYGSPEEQAALAAQNGYGFDPSLAGAGVISGSGSGGTVGATGAQGPAGPAGPAGGPAPVHTNTEWAQQAEEHLGSTATVSAALHKYISGGAMTPDQEQIAGFAISWLGYPPQRGAGGFPPGMRTQPSQGHKPGKHTIVSNGSEDLHSYAMHNGISEAQIVAWNPGLKKFAGTGKHIPRGTRIVV